MSTKTHPRSLFKYRSFSKNTLRMFSEAEVFYARPQTFNDPFDCNPTVVADVDMKVVERLWKTVTVQRFSSKGETLDVAKQKAARQLGEHRYNATEYGGRYDDNADGTGTYVRYLLRDITDYVDSRYRSYGVLSLAERWDCPLMWSHYADEHNGLCIGYATDDHRCEQLGPVDYRSSRYLQVSDLIGWILGRSAEARDKVFQQYFFAKAPQWKYEKEWRAVSKTSGATNRPFHIQSVHFGLRCDSSIITTVVKLLAGAAEEIKFYRMTSRDDGFKLRRCNLDPSEIELFGLRDSAHFAFDDFEFESAEAVGKISGTAP